VIALVPPPGTDTGGVADLVRRLGAVRT
jgi:hypothetical protein